MMGILLYQGGTQTFPADRIQISESGSHGGLGGSKMMCVFTNGCYQIVIL